MSEPSDRGRIGRLRAALAPVLRARAGNDVNARLEEVDRFLAEYGARTDAAAQPAIADAMALKLEIVGDFGSVDEALQLADEIVARFAGQPKAKFAYVASFALRCKVAVLVNAERRQDAQSAGEQLANHFERHPIGLQSLEFGEQLVEVGYMLTLNDTSEIADRLFDLVIEAYAGQTGAVNLVADAHGYALLAATRLNRPDDVMLHTAALLELGVVALARLDRIITRLDGRPARRIELLQVLLVRMRLLEDLGRQDDVTAAIRDIIDRYADEQTSVIQSYITALQTELKSEEHARDGNSARGKRLTT